jgi:hypothetical protein
MKIDDVYNFIDSLPEEEFYDYLTPESYYNTNLYYSICGDNLPRISNRKLLDIYFLLTDNEDYIMQHVYEKMYEFQTDDEDIEINGINWYIIIFYLAEILDYYNVYRRLKTTNNLNKNLVDLIELNKKFDRDNHFIFNDTDQRESFYSKDITECVLLADDRDKEMDFNEIIRTKQFQSGNINFKKGDYILYNDFKEIEKKDGSFYDKIRGDFLKAKRDIYISSLLNERIILRFNEFNL